MCDLCVINAVKGRMMSRREFFRTAAVGGAAAAMATTVATPPALAAGHDAVSDMTHELYEDFPTYFGVPGLKMEQKFKFADNGFNLFEMTLNEHTGTHIDAPLHFSADGQSVAEVPVSNLVCPLAVIDIREKAAADADAQVTPDDIAAWKSANGDIPAGACVAMNSGWSGKVASDGFRNVGDDEKMHFPGFHLEAAQMLIEDGNAVGIAVDTLSLDHGISADFATHYAWLPTNRWGLENLANLDAVPAAGATLIVGAPKVRGGSGGPSRVFAMS
ncbi:MAG: cyclase family protein [Rhodobacteraceae bacterium]|nr:cyclase family protein [Paracoccaceae bacterium]